MKVVAVTGSRGWIDKEIIRESLLIEAPDLVVQGGAPSGADKLTREICNEEGIRWETERAKWERYGKAAGNVRNGEMLQNWNPQKLLAFWDGLSPGTKDCIDKAIAMQIKFEAIAPDGGLWMA